jgi:hypothetical protein
MFLIKQPASMPALLAILITSAFGLPTSNAQTFALTDATALVPVNVKAAAVEYKGRKAVLITRDVPKTRDEDKDGFALLKGVDFQDGTIEGEIALKITAPPGPPEVRRSPGFVGIAFRARPDASHYDLFYLRPGNSTSDDQSMRNHSVQYSYVPDQGWLKLRRQWPWVYETWADLKMETWTKIKIRYIRIPEDISGTSLGHYGGVWGDRAGYLKRRLADCAHDGRPADQVEATQRILRRDGRGRSRPIRYSSGAAGVDHSCHCRRDRGCGQYSPPESRAVGHRRQYRVGLGADHPRICDDCLDLLCSGVPIPLPSLRRRSHGTTIHLRPILSGV